MHIALIAQHNIEYSIQLANALSKKESVSLVLWKNLAESYANLIDDDINVIYLHKPDTKKMGNLKLMYDTLKVLKNLKPDVIHLQNPFSWMCLNLPFIKKYPVVLTVHDPVPHLDNRKIHSRLTYKFTIKYANKMIVHGRNLKVSLMEEYNLLDESVYVIPHGDFSFFKDISTKEYNEEDGWILFFGRILQYKGLEYLIAAAPIITREIPYAKIVIAGSGEIPKQDLVNNDNFIIYNTYISNEMVDELFQKASVVVLPYIEGSQTGIIPIAYSYKKPVVVTDVGSISEVVVAGETGYIVRPRNSKELATAIIKILKNKKERERMGNNAYAKMKKDLSWDKIAEKTIEVYREVT